MALPARVLKSQTIHDCTMVSIGETECDEMDPKEKWKNVQLGRWSLKHRKRLLPLDQVKYYSDMGDAAIEEMREHDQGTIQEQIFAAIEVNDQAKYERLLKDNLDDWSFTLEVYSGTSPLHWAVLHGCSNMVSFMRESTESVDVADRPRSFNVDAQDNFGFTALHLAIFSSLWLRADTEGLMMDSPLQLIEELSRMGATSVATWEHGLPHMIYYLDTLEGLPVTVKDKYLKGPLHPLHLAIWFAPKPIIVEKLLEYWPDIASVRTSFGDSPLHLAAWRGDEGILNLLLTHLINNNILQSSDQAVNYLNRQTPLHIAAYIANKECVTTLVKCHFIQVNARNWKGLTPMEIVTTLLNNTSRYNNKKIFQELGMLKYPTQYIPRSSDRMLEKDLRHIVDLFHSLDPEALQREKQGYVDHLNAILVVAALIASASFSAWIQPPIGLSKSARYIIIENPPPDNHRSFDPIILHIFWGFNSLSFFFSLATVIAGADVALFLRHKMTLKTEVERAGHGVRKAFWYLIFAIIFLLGTFITIGLAIWPPIKLLMSVGMYSALVIGLIVCSFPLVGLLQKLTSTT